MKCSQLIVAIALSSPFAAALPVAAQAPGENLYNFYYKGTEFLELGDSQQKAYVSGLSDALNQAARDRNEPNPLIKCTITRKDKDLAETFRVWLKGNTFRQSEPAPVLFQEAIRSTCPQ